MLGISPSQSPTPLSIGVMSENSSVTPTPDQASNIEIYNDGGTTYFIAGNEMASQNVLVMLEGSLHYIFFLKAMGDSSAVTGRNQNPATIIPNFSVYFESPNSLASTKAQLHTPKQMAKSEFKMELLKRQYICMAEVIHNSKI